MSYRSDTVSRIDIAITMYGMVRTPLSLGESRRAHTKITTARYIVVMSSIVEFHLTQVMLITTSTMQYLAEQTLANHIQRSHTVTTITYVLHDIQMASGCFRNIYQIPALLDRISGGNLHAYIRNTSLHSGDRHRYVPFPRTCDDHAIKLLVVQHILKFTFTPFVNFRSRDIKFSDMFQGTIDRALLDIANRYDLITGDRQYIINMLMASRTRSDETET